MQPLYDYKKFVILYIDDEEISLKYFIKALEKDFRIITASTPAQGLLLFQQLKNELAILVSDQRMPGMQGIEVLERARQLQPRVLRILVTAYTDLGAAIDAINIGSIYKYISKPWETSDLCITMRRAMEYFLMQREREHLLQEKLSALHNMLITDRVVSLGVLAAGLGQSLRNSIPAIRAFLQLAPAKSEASHFQQLGNPNFWVDFYQHVQGQVKRIIELLGGLGLTTLPQQPHFPDHFQVSDVTQLALSKMQAQFQEKRIEITTRFSPKLPEITADKKTFQRMIESLLSAELAQLPAGSRISLSTLSPPTDSPPGVRLEISDNGPGISDDAIRSVFDPVFIPDGSPSDFGIHLLACYLIVHHHSGKIEIANRERKGSTFTLDFPTIPPKSSADRQDVDFLPGVLINEALWEKLLETRNPSEAPPQTD